MKALRECGACGRLSTRHRINVKSLSWRWKWGNKMYFLLLLTNKPTASHPESSDLETSARSGESKSSVIGERGRFTAKNSGVNMEEGKYQQYMSIIKIESGGSRRESCYLRWFNVQNAHSSESS